MRGSVNKLEQLIRVVGGGLGQDIDDTRNHAGIGTGQALPKEGQGSVLHESDQERHQGLGGMGFAETFDEPGDAPTSQGA